jgi:hypothetical protein
MYSVPLVKVELEHMRQTMIVALSDYQERISQSVNEQLEDIVNNFDFSKVVDETATKVIEEAIRDALTNYFKYGDGHKIIETTISKMLKQKS